MQLLALSETVFQVKWSEDGVLVIDNVQGVVWTKDLVATAYQVKHISTHCPNMYLEYMQYWKKMTKDVATMNQMELLYNDLTQFTHYVVWDQDKTLLMLIANTVVGDSAFSIHLELWLQDFHCVSNVLPSPHIPTKVSQIQEYFLGGIGLTSA